MTVECYLCPKLNTMKKILPLIKNVAIPKMSDELCERLLEHLGEVGYDKFVRAFPNETIHTGTMKKWQLRTRMYADFKLNISIVDFMRKYELLRGGYYYWLKLYNKYLKKK